MDLRGGLYPGVDPRGGKAPPRGGFERGGGLYPGGGVEPPPGSTPAPLGRAPPPPPPPLLDPYLGNTDPEGWGGRPLPFSTQFTDPGGGGGGGCSSLLKLNNGEWVWLLESNNTNENSKSTPALKEPQLQRALITLSCTSP